MLHSVKQKATDLQVWQAFRSKEQLIITSDGGLDNQIGTFGWVIAKRKIILFECGGPVDGPYDTTSSTPRSELCGFTLALLLIAAISRHWGLPHRCPFRWITDTKAALRRVIRIVRRGPPIRHLPPPRLRPPDSHPFLNVGNKTRHHDEMG